MKKTACWAGAALGAVMASINAQTVLDSGHLDLGVAFEDGAFDLHIHDETNEQEYAPNEAALEVGAASLAGVPSDSRYSFLGPAGSLVYTLPQVQNSELIFLGVGAEEIASGLFQGDRVTFALRAIAGPGAFAGYSVDGLGNPTIHFNSRDGLDAADRLSVPAGGHADINWSFSAPGEYRLAFEAEGTLANGGTVASGPVEYRFNVVPEPSVFALLGLGSLVLAGFIRRRS